MTTMMARTIRALALGAVVTASTAGCATKGFVRRSIADMRASVDSAITTERTARISGDSALATDIAALRRDLQALRTEFGARITAVEQGIQFAFPVNFAFDDATVRPEDEPALDRFAQVAQKYYGGAKITVEGFADPAGSQQYNLGLSRRRAEAVRTHLLSRGLTEDVLGAVGYGEARPVVPGAQRDEPGAEQNRRVVFVVETKGPIPSGIASADRS